MLGYMAIVLAKYSVDKLRLFLFWATSSYHIPKKLELKWNEKPDQTRLPTSSTCVYRINVSHYISPTKLATDLDVCLKFADDSMART